MPYKLLRSNKESGPYSLNDLVTLGLKPYDLIWVDGRSAAWRYPSEVAELKDFAPAVEEQPYDRFYKKPSESENVPNESLAKEPTAATHVEIVPQNKAIQENITKEEELFTSNLNDGFLTRIEALNNLIKNNTALQFRYYLLVVILLLIELMPVIAKTLLPSGTYDEKVRLIEEMEGEIVRSNIKKEQQIKRRRIILSHLHCRKQVVVRACNNIVAFTRQDSASFFKIFSFTTI